MSINSAEIARGVISQGLQITALAVLVWLLVRLCARTKPHLAHILWLIVLVKCLFPPVVPSATGIFCWMQWKPNSPQQASVATPDAVVAAEPLALSPISEIDRGFGHAGTAGT